MMLFMLIIGRSTPKLIVNLFLILLWYFDFFFKFYVYNFH